jgi:hypothetical protein
MARIVSGGRRGRRPDRYRRVRRAIRSVVDVVGWPEFDETFQMLKKPGQPELRFYGYRSPGVNVPEYQKRNIVLAVRREVAAAARRWPTRAHLAQSIGLLRRKRANREAA